MLPGRRRAWCLTFALCAGILGFVVNSQKLVLFANVPVLLGGTFSLAVALLLGPWYGLLASVVGSLPVLGVWSQPGIFLLTLFSPFVVGLLVRRGWRPLVAAMVCWVVGGAPLLAVTFLFRQGAIDSDWLAMITPLLGNLTELVSCTLSCTANLPPLTWLGHACPHLSGILSWRIGDNS